MKKHRIKQDLSQEDFVKKSGVKYTTLTKIAQALGVNIEDLIK